MRRSSSSSLLLLAALLAAAAAHGQAQPRSGNGLVLPMLPLPPPSGMQQRQQQQQPTGSVKPPGMVMPTLQAPGANGSTPPGPASAASKSGSTSGAAAASNTAAPSTPGAVVSSKPAGGDAVGPVAKAAAADPAGSLHKLLAEEAPLFRSLLDVLGITPRDIKPSTVATLFAPTDKAVEALLKSMGLSAKELTGRPGLVDLIVSYHLLPGHQLRSAGDLGASTKVAASGDDQFILRLGRKSGKLTVTDVQRNKATAVRGPLSAKDAAGVSVFVVDKVLSSGNYFPSIQAALTHSPHWIAARALFDKAPAVLPQLSDATVTLLVPTNTALAPVAASVSRFSPGRLAEVLQYHVLQKARSVPDGFQPGGSTPTLLKGHSVDVKVNISNTEQDPFQGRRVAVPRVTIAPEIGRPARIVTYNVFAGRSVLHGIDGVLLPDLPKDPNEAPGDEPAAASAEEAPEETDAMDVLNPDGSLRGPEATGSVATKPGPAAAARPTTTSSSSSRGRTIWPAGMAAPAGNSSGTDDSNDDDGVQSNAAPGYTGLKSKGRGGLKPLIIPRIAGGATPTGAAAGLAAGAAPATPRLAPGSRRPGVVQETGIALTVLPGGASLPGKIDAADGGTAEAVGDDEAGSAAPQGATKQHHQRPHKGTHVMVSSSNSSNATGHHHAKTASSHQDAFSFDNLRPPRGRDEIAISGSGDPGRRLRRLLSAMRRRLLQPAGTPATTMAIGSVGVMQTFANGISTNKTRSALELAAQPALPKQYRNRYGALPRAAAKGGCLNCRAWGKQQ